MAQPDSMQQPAEAMLASALWTAHLRSTSNTKAAQFGSGSVMAALGRPLDYGRTCCISAEDGSGARELVQDVLISHLLSSPTATATIIDTAFAVDVRKLHSAIVRLNGSDARTAAEVLDRVEIMKVFDFIGLKESLDELRVNLRGTARLPDARDLPTATIPRGTAADSEDEEEMLDDPTPHKPRTAPNDPRPNDGPRMLIIDNLSHVVGPLLKNNFVQGQALLTTFTRSLAHLTNTHNLCTVIMNGVAPGNKTGEESFSAFASCTLQPALGKLFAYLPDVHLLVHRMPRKHGRRGAEALEDCVSTIEVLHDRYGYSFGEWVAVTVDENGLLAKVS